MDVFAFVTLRVGSACGAVGDECHRREALGWAASCLPVNATTFPLAVIGEEVNEVLHAGAAFGLYVIAAEAFRLNF